MIDCCFHLTCDKAELKMVLNLKCSHCFGDARPPPTLLNFPRACLDSLLLFIDSKIAVAPSQCTGQLTRVNLVVLVYHPQLKVIIDSANEESSFSIFVCVSVIKNAAFQTYLVLPSICG